MTVGSTSTDTDTDTNTDTGTDDGDGDGDANTDTFRVHGLCFSNYRYIRRYTMLQFRCIMFQFNYFAAT